MKKEIAAKILAQTETGYDLIADKFSATRKHFWRGLEWIGDHAQSGDKILDFGCGNGRLLELIGIRKIEYLGVDVSEKLIEIAKNKYPQENIHPHTINNLSNPHFYPINLTENTSSKNQTQNTNGVGVKFQKISGSDRLPFTENYFNSVYSIAVFHHLPSREYRKKTAGELFRVMQPGGRVVITAWNLFQPKYLKNLLSNWLSNLTGKSDLDWNDCYIPFTDNQGRVFRRYHHAFTKGELKRLFTEAGFRVEKCEMIGGRNLVLIGRKPPHQ